ncbi:MAG: hypothetical protein P1U35_03860 [Cycloclasticus sp.]|nr:hypothetical protein [Cycloclasticus sp.]
MELIFWTIGILIGISVVKSFLSKSTSNSESITQANNSEADEDEEESGPGFYLNETDAMSHGAMFKMGDDDDGPGFYI